MKFYLKSIAKTIRKFFTKKKETYYMKAIVDKDGRVTFERAMPTITTFSTEDLT